MLDEKEILKYLYDSQALQKGHFVLSSGLHSEGYVQCALLLKNPKRAEIVCRALAEKFKEDKIELVVGPALGGIIAAYEVARQLGVENIFAERKDGKMTLRRGFSVEKGQRVLVMEDVITTGGSSQEVVELLEKLGAEVVCAGSIIDRSSGAVKLTVPYKSLIKLDIKTFEKKDCPLCAKNIAEDKPGSRSK